MKPIKKRKRSYSNTSSLSSEDSYRRSRILASAAELFGAAGFRVSLAEIADSAGILAGSLYHYFESKEAIFAELAKAYSSELNQIALNSLADVERGSANFHFDKIVTLASNVAACAANHRAALLNTIYEYPAGSTDGINATTTQAVAVVGNAMMKILHDARADGFIRNGIDLPRLTERICRSMLYSGIGILQQKSSVAEVPRIRCQILLEGIAVDRPKEAKLNRSKAFAAAGKAIANWSSPAGSEESLDRLRVAARTEFGRQGYETTTIRDVASAAGMSMGSVYRRISTKDELLEFIINSFARNVISSWDAVLDTSSTPIEKMDALIWTNINALAQFPDEFKIGLAWLREAPPTTTANLNQITHNLSHIRTVLAEGEKSGDFRVIDGSRDLRTNCLFGLTWIVEASQKSVAINEVLNLARETVICGAAQR